MRLQSSLTHVVFGSSMRALVLFGAFACACQPFAAGSLNGGDASATMTDGGPSSSDANVDSGSEADGADGGAGACSNGALDFAGGSVEVPQNSGLDSAASLTLEAWIKPRTEIGTKEVHIISHHDHNTSDGYVLMLFNGLKFRAYSGTTSGRMSEIVAPQIDLGVWHHVAAVFDGGGTSPPMQRLFIDGKGVTKTSSVSSIDPYNGPLRIGQAAYADNFQYGGIIDEVRVSRVARYKADFTPAYPLPDNESETIGTWHFTEGSGVKAGDTTTQQTGTLKTFDASQFPVPAWVTPECPVTK